MMSRSPGRAPTTPAESERHSQPLAWIDAVAGLSRHAGVLCVASALALAAMALLEIFYFRALSGGLSSLDLRVAGFKPEDGIAWLMALGSRGSEALIVWHYLTFALLFPLLLSLTLVSMILALARRVPLLAVMPVRALAVLAVLLVLPYTLADYGQDVAIVQLLSDVSSANPDSLALASTLVVTKFALLAVPLLVVAALAFAGRRMEEQP